MQAKRFINQTFTLIMAALLLMVSGVKSWSVDQDKLQTSYAEGKSSQLARHDSKIPDSEQAKLSSLSLDAVITPAISFDFFQYFYFLSQPVWNSVQKVSIVEVSFREPVFLVSCFYRIFGSYIVTNAP